MPITLKQIRYFISVVDSGSITGSAKALNVAQTAIGVQLRLLEERLGVPLLVREPRGIAATNAGRHFYSRAKEIVAQVELSKREICELFGEVRRGLFIGVAPSIRAAVGFKLLLLQRTELQSSLCLREGRKEDLLDDLRSGAIDYAIAHDVAPQRDLRAVPVLRQPLRLVTAPGMGPPPGPVALRDALRGPLALNTGSSVTFSNMEQAARRIGQPLKVAFRTDSVAALKQLVSEGLAWGILPHELVSSEVTRGEIAAYQLVDPALDITAYFVVREADLGRGLDIRLLRLLDRLLDEHSAGCACQRLGSICSLQSEALV